MLSSLLLVLTGIANPPAAPPADTDLVEPPAPITGGAPRADAAPIPWVLTPVLGIRAEASETEQRPKAIEYSDAYHVRLKIHQIGSYLELPLFAAELIVGQKLAHDRDRGEFSSSGLRGAHTALATGLGVLFTVNTVTGLWNLWESRKDPAGRTRRILHTVGMLAADAGFLATAGAAPEGGDDFGEREGGSVGRHRNLAIASVSVATLSTAMMWLWKD